MPETGPDDETRALVLARAGERCEHCGVGIRGPRGYSLQHRIARRMGGTRASWINLASNLAVLCGSATTACHGLAERRNEAMRLRGYWLESWQVPAEIPIRLFTGQWVELTDTGLYLPVNAPIAA